jgi:urea transport system ATP-binding protein
MAERVNELILDARDVTVTFDGFKALDNLAFSMSYGELRFVIGPNGAGKTTFLDIVTGKTRPNHGQVTFDGSIDVLRWPEHKLVQHGVSCKFQTPTIFSSLTVYENLEASISHKRSLLNLFAPIPAEDKETIDSILDLIGLYDRMHVRAGTLSHGEKQWLEIGMLLVQKPKLLLLDEPVAGMTRHERTRTGELLQSISKYCSVLVVEHDMEFVRNFANTVSVLHMGKLLCEGPVEKVQSDSQVIEVYLGRACEDVALAA